MIPCSRNSESKPCGKFRTREWNGLGFMCTSRHMKRSSGFELDELKSEREQNSGSNSRVVAAHEYVRARVFHMQLCNIQICI